jgi:hypothetical protein
LADLQFLTRDVNGTMALSEDVAKRCQAIAADLGYPSALFPFTFGGGGTDAAEFARIGVPATTILAMPTTWVREGLVYHTTRDTTDNIERGTVKATLEVCHEFIRRLDAGSE